MDFEAVLTAVRSWPREDRLRLIEEVWDDLPEQDHPAELTEDLKSLLERRIAALEKNPDAVVPWEVVEARRWSVSGNEPSRRLDCRRRARTSMPRPTGTRSRPGWGRSSPFRCGGSSIKSARRRNCTVFFTKISGAPRSTSSHTTSIIGCRPTAWRSSPCFTAAAIPPFGKTGARAAHVGVARRPCKPKRRRVHPFSAVSPRLVQIVGGCSSVVGPTDTIVMGTSGQRSRTRWMSAGVTRA